MLNKVKTKAIATNSTRGFTWFKANAPIGVRALRVNNVEYKKIGDNKVFVL
jgi:hypothetical protein